MPARGVALVGMSGVSWVCRHKRYGAVLALIALALQIALTFGHVHLRGVARAGLNYRFPITQ